MSKTGGAIKYDGYISARWSTRTAVVSDFENGDSPYRYNDNDLYGTIKLDLSTPGSDGYEFHLLAIGKQDIDGNQEDQGYNPFEGLDDTQSSGYGRVHLARFDSNQTLGFKQIRLGRQNSTRGDWISFDGVAGDLEIGKSLLVTVYGGIPVHAYETEEGSDFLAGSGIDWRFSSASKLQVDFLLADDQRTNRIIFYDEKNNRVEFEDQQDQLLSLRYHLLYGQASKAKFRLRWLNGEQRDVDLKSANTELFWGTDLFISYFRQSMSEAQLSNETSAFYDVFGIRKPYQSYEVKLTKRFGDQFTLDLGTFQRSLLESTDESAFNRAYSRSYLIFELYDLIRTGTTLSVSQEVWESLTYSGNAFGFDAELKLATDSKPMTFNVGSYFSLYKYDYYIDLGEQTEVETFYAKAKIPFWDRYTFTVLYEYEFSSDYDIGTKEMSEKGVFTLRRDF